MKFQKLEKINLRNETKRYFADIVNYSRYYLYFGVTNNFFSILISVNEIEDKIYGTKDYDRTIVLTKRTEAVAKEITRFLKKTDRFNDLIRISPGVGYKTKLFGDFAIALELKARYTFVDDLDFNNDKIDSLKNRRLFPLIESTAPTNPSKQHKVYHTLPV